MRCRLATAADVAAINDIYNHEVRTGVATFDTEEVALAARAAWLAEHAASAAHPVVVADDGGAVVGWASLSRWSPRRAYDRTAEVSVYIHADHRGRGVGGALLDDLIGRARASGLGVLLARIADAGPASMALHQRRGFVRVGTLHRVGEKFGRVLDVEVLEMSLES